MLCNRAQINAARQTGVRTWAYSSNFWAALMAATTVKILMAAAMANATAAIRCKAIRRQTPRPNSPAFPAMPVVRRKLQAAGSAGNAALRLSWPPARNAKRRWRPVQAFADSAECGCRRDVESQAGFFGTLLVQCVLPDAMRLLATGDMRCPRRSPRYRPRMTTPPNSSE
jgi:hypothetical protein